MTSFGSTAVVALFVFVRLSLVIVVPICVHIARSVLWSCVLLDSVLGYMGR